MFQKCEDAKKPESGCLKITGKSKILFCSLLAATLFAGCDNDSSKGSGDNGECTEHAQCADRQDGKTECDLVNNVCVEPTQPGVECNTPADCANRQDGKTDCDSQKHVCVTPGSGPHDQQSECGDGKLSAGESCDKEDLNGKSCLDFDEFIDGTLACNAKCEFDKSGCIECTATDTSKCTGNKVCSESGRCVEPGHEITCGDDLAEGDEECDGSDLRDKTCADRGYVAGELGCSTECVFETDHCVMCDETHSCEDGKTCVKGSCVDKDPVCGDGYLSPGESCEKVNLNGKSCEQFPEYIGGKLDCNAACEFDKSGCIECNATDATKCTGNKICNANGRCVDPDHTVTCGDDLAEDPEPCDGSDLRGKSCADYGKPGGELKCNKCAIDLSKCIECSDDSHCAGNENGKTKCDLANNICIEPPFCGNSAIDAGENCDKSALNGKTCSSFDEFLGGQLACNNSCEFDKTGCYQCTSSNTSKCAAGQICNANGRCIDPGHTVSCGDNKAEDPEPCDGSDLKDKTCADVAPAKPAGTLQCKGCSFDISGCLECTDDSHCAKNASGNGKTKCDRDKNVCVDPPAVCGDGKLSAGESCDKSNLNNKKCVDFGFLGGTLACNSSCEFDKTKCYECTSSNTSKCANGQICNENGRCVDPTHTIKCGDNIAEGSEACDGEDLNGKKCADIVAARPAGTLSCTDKCAFDISGCYECDSNADCSGNANGKTVCQGHVCVEPEPVKPSTVVISQIYPGGGNAGATYKTKYVELFNRGTEAVDISKWSIQYGAPTNNTISAICDLPDNTSLPKGGYYLVALSSGSNGETIPAADKTCSSMSAGGTNGKFFLVNSGNKLSSSTPESGYVDAIGYGSANWAEGNAAAAALSSTKAALRNHGGCDDTNNNAADFTAGTPTPRNSSSQRHDCSVNIEPEDNPTACKDTVDNDGDGKTDCNDPECQALEVCKSDENTPETCSDEWDNDGDGKIDCNDPDCQTLDVCRSAENNLEACTDEIDNDGDNKIDCDDPECADFCKPCGDKQTYIAKYDLCAHNITSKAEFLTFRDTWNSGGADEYIIEEGKPAAFILINDIALATQSGWVSIGTDDKPFNGMFFGNNKKISGILTSTNGLFGIVKDATIKDLNLALSASGTDSVGILARKATTTSIINVTVNGNAEASADRGFVGGVVNLCDNCYLKNVSYTGNVKGQFVGGVIGEGNGSLSQITADVTTSVVYGSGEWAGLIRRVENSGFTIQDADIKFNYTNTYSSFTKNTSNIIIGGAIGEIATNSKATINNLTLNQNIDANISKISYSSSGCSSSSGSKTYAYYGGISGVSYGELNVDNAQIKINTKMSVYSAYSDNDELNNDTLMGGVSATSAGGSLNNVKLIFNRFDSSADHSYQSKCYQYSYKGLLFQKVSNTEIQNVSIHQNASSLAGPDPYVFYTASATTLSNLSLISKYSGLEFAYQLSNSSFSTAFIDDLDTSSTNSIFDTVVYKSIAESPDFTVNNSSKYESAEKTVEIMNKGLADKTSVFLEGNYYPWFVDSEGNPDLNFDAAENEMYTYP